MHCVFHIRQIFKERGAVAPVRSELRPEGAVPMARAGPKTAGRKAGGANRDRTDDLLLAKQALSQLSYGPIKDWWVWEESNFRPHPYQGCALTN